MEGFVASGTVEPYHGTGKNIRYYGTTVKMSEKACYPVVRESRKICGIIRPLVIAIPYAIRRTVEDQCLLCFPFFVSATPTKTLRKLVLGTDWLTTG